MGSGLWIKEIDNPVLKPLDQWRRELYGYWMVATDTDYYEKDGVKTATARVKYYGTDRDKLYDLWDELCRATENADVGIYHNVCSKWLGELSLLKLTVDLWNSSLQ